MLWQLSNWLFHWKKVSPSSRAPEPGTREPSGSYPPGRARREWGILAPSLSEGGTSRPSPFASRRSVHLLSLRQEVHRSATCERVRLFPSSPARGRGNSAATINWIFMRQDLILMRQGGTSFQSSAEFPHPLPGTEFPAPRAGDEGTRGTRRRRARKSATWIK